MNEGEFRAAQQKIESALQAYPDNELSGVSDIWQAYFDTRNSGYDFASASRLLSEDNDSTYGVAIKIPGPLKGIYRRFYEQFYGDEAVPPMPEVGHPASLDVGGRFADVAYLQNYTRTREIIPLARKLGRKVHVLEIGAGYGGMAQQFIASGLVESYTVIDLPLNLQLSNFYLRSVFPSYRANTCQDFSFEKALNFLIPQQIDEIAERTFDVAINCDSFGEMPAATAQAYLRFLAAVLTHDGFAYIKNAHRHRPITVQKVTEYGYDQFDILSLRPTLFPSLVFDHHHHMVVLGKKTGAQSIEPAHLDIFAELVRSGIHGEVIGLGERIAGGRLTSDDHAFLAAVERLYRGELSDWRPDDADLSAALDYLTGVELANRGSGRSRPLLERYCSVSRSAAAEAISLFILSRRGRRISFSQPFMNGVRTEFLLRTMKLDPTKFWQGVLLWRLRKPMLEAVTRPYGGVRKSWPVLAKNLALNLRDGRGLSLSRLT